MKCSSACSKKFRRVVKLVRVEHSQKVPKKIGRKVTSLCWTCYDLYRVYETRSPSL